MADLVLLTIVVTFFAAAGGFVLVCDRIIGPAEEASTTAATSLPPVESRSAEAA